MSERWNLHRPREYVHVQLRTGIQWNTVSNWLVSRRLKVFREAARIVSKQSNVKGAAHHEKNSHVYLCAKGYAGKYCEAGCVLFVMGLTGPVWKNDPKGTVRKRERNKQKKKNKAELVELVEELSPYYSQV